MSPDPEVIKKLAADLGFLSCGISKATMLAEEAPRLEKWLNQKHHGTMSWMENHFDKRLDPTKLVPGAKSVISVLYNYFPSKQQNPGAPKISKYAFGVDYHFVVKDKLRALVEQIQALYGDFHARVFVDSAPVMERAWAAKSGLGWIGKHSLLLNKQQGSFFFIGQIICDLKISEDGPTTDHCGTCTACIDACPTNAIVENKVVDANKCISYLTIELREEIPPHFKDSMDGWAFGCDICQDVCPWNRFSKPHNEPSFEPLDGVISNNINDWLEFSSSAFKKRFRKSAISRTGFNGFMRNMRFIASNTKNKDD